MRSWERLFLCAPPYQLAEVVASQPASVSATKFSHGLTHWLPHCTQCTLHSAMWSRHTARSDLSHPPSFNFSITRNLMEVGSHCLQEQSVSSHSVIPTSLHCFRFSIQVHNSVISDSSTQLLILVCTCTNYLIEYIVLRIVAEKGFAQSRQAAFPPPAFPDGS